MSVLSRDLGDAVLAVIRFAATWIPPLASWIRGSAEKYTERALESYQRGDNDNAVANFREVLGWEPVNPDALSALGQIYYEQGKADAAEELFRKALDSDYTNLRALKGLGGILQEKNLPLDALYFYLRYVELEHEDADVCHNLGVLFYGLGKNENAAEWFRRAEGQNPGDPLIRKNYSLALVALGRFNEARDTLLRARELAPEDAEVDSFLGWALGVQGDLDRALEAYESSLRKDPQSPNVHLEYARLVGELGRHQEAIEHARTAADLFRAAGDDQGAGDAYWELGWSYCNLGDLTASLEASTEALELNPMLTPVYFNLGLALLLSGRVAEARQRYEEGIARLSEISDLKEHAIDDLRNALEKDPQLDGAAEILATLEVKYVRLSKKVQQSASQATA